MKAIEQADSKCPYSPALPYSPLPLLYLVLSCLPLPYIILLCFLWHFIAVLYSAALHRPLVCCDAVLYCVIKRIPHISIFQTHTTSPVRTAYVQPIDLTQWIPLSCPAYLQFFASRPIPIPSLGRGRAIKQGEITLGKMCKDIKKIMLVTKSELKVRTARTVRIA